MTFLVAFKKHLRNCLVLMLACAACASLNGCLLAAAGAGAAGGYMIGKESEKDKREEVHIHEEHYHQEAPDR